LAETQTPTHLDPKPTAYKSGIRGNFLICCYHGSDIVGLITRNVSRIVLPICAKLALMVQGQLVWFHCMYRPVTMKCANIACIIISSRPLHNTQVSGPIFPASCFYAPSSQGGTAVVRSGDEGGPRTRDPPWKLVNLRGGDVFLHLSLFSSSE